MPTYDFYNTETEEVFERFMTIGAKEDYLKENPHILDSLGISLSNPMYKDLLKRIL